MERDNLIGGFARSRRRQLVPRLDALEGRELKDGGISLVAGTIAIEGSAGANSVVVSYTDATHGVVAVAWNGATTVFSRSVVTAISFNGHDGSNTFSDLTDISAVARGGNGRNAFFGGTGQNTFSGGDGLNIFHGNGTADSMTGGNGTNIFYAGPGRDTLTGGNGSNIFSGVSAQDSVAVGTGFHFIRRR